MKIRYARFSDPARGGRKIEERILDRHTIVMLPGGICRETHREVWLDIGTLMDEVTNHVKEQPTNKWKQALIDAPRRVDTCRNLRGQNRCG